MFDIHLKQFVWALSLTADLVGVTDLSHGKRVAFYAERIADNMVCCLPWSRDDIIAAALLHDCGVSSTDIHEHLVKELEWARVNEHCTRGAELLASSGLLCRYAAPVRLHHTRWSLYEGSGEVAPEALLGNLVFLADRLDVLIATQRGEVLMMRQRIMEILQGYSGLLFNPDFVLALERAAATEAFWLVREEAQLYRHFQDWFAHEDPVRVERAELEELFKLFGAIVDAKSRFTGTHSRAVSELCYEIAARMGLEEFECFRLALAGLVHDIGKLRVPDAILNKPGSLNESEYSTMKHHSFDCLDILEGLNGFEDVARDSSQHHERLDGSGYPYQLSGADIALGARILAVADITQSLAQNRPYRQGLDDAEIKSMLQLEANRGRIDPQVLRAVLDGFPDLMRIARQGAGQGADQG